MLLLPSSLNQSTLPNDRSTAAATGVVGIIKPVASSMMTDTSINRRRISAPPVPISHSPRQWLSSFFTNVTHSVVTEQTRAPVENWRTDHLGKTSGSITRRIPVISALRIRVFSIECRNL